MEIERGTLAVGEAHPMSRSAWAYIASHSIERLHAAREAMASCAIEGSRAAEICGETLDRIIARQPVSDRYVLGLAWMMMEMEKNEK